METSKHYTINSGSPDQNRIAAHSQEELFMRAEWSTFNGGVWEREINVRDFIQKNYTPYDGDGAFLAGPTQATKDLWAQVLDLSEQERKAGGVLDMVTWIKIKRPS